jgi:hypothetical protein
MRVWAGDLNTEFTEEAPSSGRERVHRRGAEGAENGYGIGERGGCARTRAAVADGRFAI